MKVYGLPSGQSLDRRNDMSLACGSGHIIPAVQGQVYGLPSGQGLDRRNDMSLACGSGHIIPAVQALARGQSINPHSILS